MSDNSVSQNSVSDNSDQPYASDQPYVDTQSLTDADMGLYETIATLEYLGRPPTRGEIASAADLDEETLDRKLGALTERELLVRRDIGGEACFEPASRGWSTSPEQTTGPGPRRI